MANRMDIPSFDTAFTRMIDEDIKKCEEYLTGDRDAQKGTELHLELITKYPPYISHFGDSLYNYDPSRGFVMIEYFDSSAMIHNMTIIKNRLIAFKNYGYKNSKSVATDKSISIENTLTATQNQTVYISFEDVKQRIEAMTGLSEVETKEALEKIDTIKLIVESEDPKKTKWQKVKPILVWLADKSVDVGIALLPLLLKIGG